MAALFVGLQYILPKRLLTALMWRFARIRHAGFKNFLITRFIAAFNLNVEEVKRDIPDQFANFNEFFVRELADGARPIDAEQSSVVSPADGTISIAATIQENALIQAKGMTFTLQDLLATDLDKAETFVDGIFATIYLAPHNYHRVHAPLAGVLEAAHYIPGSLFSVNDSTATRVNGLFRRNERLVMNFRTPAGPFAVVFVGALMVGSISTPWSGEIRPRTNGSIATLDLSDHPRNVEKGDLLGWFNMGSTVILLLPKNMASWHADTNHAMAVTVGKAIGNLRNE